MNLSIVREVSCREEGILAVAKMMVGLTQWPTRSQTDAAVDTYVKARCAGWSHETAVLSARTELD